MITKINGTNQSNYQMNSQKTPTFKGFIRVWSEKIDSKEFSDIFTGVTREIQETGTDMTKIKCKGPKISDGTGENSFSILSPDDKETDTKLWSIIYSLAKKNKLLQFEFWPKAKDARVPLDI